MTRLILGAYRLSLLRRLGAFQRALGAPERTQLRLLWRFLSENALTKVGQRFGYATLHGVRAFQDRIPVQTYDSLARDLAACAAGAPSVLTRGKILRFELSSGSSAAHKLLPVTKSFLRELSSATGPWLCRLLSERRVRQGAHYWAISPAGPHPRMTDGGIRIGAADDTEYFGPWARRAIRKVLAAPAELAHEVDVEVWRRKTLLSLLAREDLALISVWSPTFLLRLMESLRDALDELLPLLPSGRARAIAKALAGAGGLSGHCLWPGLAVISCWADGPSAAFVPRVQALFPGVRIEPKGLLATEGVVSIPFGPGDPVAAVGSHFLEFEQLDDAGKRPLLAHELRVGGAYSPLLTTGAGLLRYRLGDVVRCTGFIGGAPTLRFEGRADAVSDLCGEKLSPERVQRALSEATSATNVAVSFALLSPARSGPSRYLLFVEPKAAGPLDLVRLASELDRRLCEGHPYRHCRELGQLAAVEAVPVSDGWAVYEAELLSRGVRAGTLKPTALDARGDWAERFVRRAAS